MNRTTRLYRDSVAAVSTWCRKRKMRLTAAPRHVYPRSYVVGRVAAQCLIVARPWQDAEPHLRKFDQLHRVAMASIHDFDESLQSGDWCITAYVCEHGNQRQVAVPIPESAHV